MQPTLILLPGWGLGSAALEPLVLALNAQGICTELAHLPILHSSDPCLWLDELDARLPDGVWLGGWSLGGMLATALAARRGNRCPGLVTLATNACFVARPDWPDAMPVETFAKFRAGFAEDPNSTLRRFAMLCAQGGVDSRRVARQLQQNLPVNNSTSVGLAGLNVLAALHNGTALQTFAGPQRHFFAREDALVPVVAVAPYPLNCTEVCEGCHAFLLEQPEALAERIGSWIREVAHG